jgi:hypothetical protein
VVANVSTTREGHSDDYPPNEAAASCNASAESLTDIRLNRMYVENMKGTEARRNCIAFPSLREKLRESCCRVAETEFVV